MRERASEFLNATEETSLGLQAQARFLERQQRYAETAAFYERELAPADQTCIHVELILRLMRCYFNAGRPADIFGSGEAVIALATDYADRHGASDGRDREQQPVSDGQSRA